MLVSSTCTTSTHTHMRGVHAHAHAHAHALCLLAHAHECLPHMHTCTHAAYAHMHAHECLPHTHARARDATHRRARADTCTLHTCRMPHMHTCRICTAAHEQTRAHTAHGESRECAHVSVYGCVRRCGHVGLPRNTTACSETDTRPAGVCAACGEDSQTNFIRGTSTDGKALPWIEGAPVSAEGMTKMDEAEQVARAQEGAVELS